MEKAKLIGNTIIMVHNDEYCDTRDIVNEIKNWNLYNNSNFLDRNEFKYE